METEMKFDEKRGLWVCRVDYISGITIFGYGKTQEEARKDFEKNRDEMWEW